MYTAQGNARSEQGKRAEQFASEYLIQTLGYRIWRRNWRCRLGELDIVCWDADCLVIVEVRSRSSERFGSFTTAVTPEKARQVLRLVPVLLLDAELKHVDFVRFDVITMAFSGSTVQDFHHERDAFDGFI